MGLSYVEATRTLLLSNRISPTCCRGSASMAMSYSLEAALAHRTRPPSSTCSPRCSPTRDRVILYMRGGNAMTDTIATERCEVDPVTAIAPVGSTELPSLRSESERLRLERDNAQLRAELAALSKPWWRKASVVTTLAAIAAAILPVTTAVQAHYEKERELALQEGKQSHEIRTSYLDRLDKPGARLRTLRFVLATTTDPSLLQWAKTETQEVQAEINELDRRIAEIAEQLSTLPADAPTPPGASSSPAATNSPAATDPRDPCVDDRAHDQRRLLEEKWRKLKQLKSSALIDI